MRKTEKNFERGPQDCQSRQRKTREELWHSERIFQCAHETVTQRLCAFFCGSGLCFWSVGTSSRSVYLMTCSCWWRHTWRFCHWISGRWRTDGRCFWGLESLCSSTKKAARESQVCCHISWVHPFFYLLLLSFLNWLALLEWRWQVAVLVLEFFHLLFFDPVHLHFLRLPRLLRLLSVLLSVHYHHYLLCLSLPFFFCE